MKRADRWLRWRPTAWEACLVALILMAGAWSAYLSPYYLDIGQILDSGRQFIIPGLLAFGLLPIVLTGEIDISLASNLAIGAVLLGHLSAAGVSPWLAVPVVLAVCALLGAVNGVLVSWMGLPSLAITLGTMGAYRGLAYIIGLDTGYTDFDDAYLSVGSGYVFGIVPVSLVLFLGVAVVMAFLIHGTVFGRRIFAVGRNSDAARIVGIDVTRLKIVTYAMAGALAGLAALVWIGQYGSARGDNADGSVLFVVTAVVLGGVDINGGRGTVLGVTLALLLLGTLRNGMGLANVGGPVQTVVLGALLLLGVLRPVALRAYHAVRSGAARGKAQAAGT
ncbi:Monosaccharide-transporting ATPase [Gluconacetobacter diazotrophicus PA1 5]|uniref:ABC transporter permease n=1 Tax=Gluconacetobacter diazotrophicus TaxID=33996 RepID=UPI000173D961|nr:ABC transporter permease [Gluconacetobacter diazotrophicus]ACI52348.1 Monosaccharide-transporting ATPase [Gluconacetobacter diazotrophicus PA1 5]TWB05556.1 monosaccharide ABC transporter membrane protein (CUT2 family) [Gluconacetobacter diazotrophicus]